MSHQEITPDFIKHCLYTTTDYKNSKIIKQAVSEGQEQYFQVICEAIHEILVTKGYPPMAKLLALRLSKELIDLFNMKFVKIFEDNVLFALREFAMYQCQSSDPNRGNTFFGENSEKDVKQIGVSLVRLSLDCVKAWAMFFPQSDTKEIRKFYSFYQDLIQQKVNFPPWAYYKQDFVEIHESPHFKEVDLLSTQKIANKPVDPVDPVDPNKNNQQFLNSKPLQIDPQIKVAHSQQSQKIGPPSEINITPGNPTPMDPRDNPITKAKQVIQLCVNLKEQTGDICAHTLVYQSGNFDDIRDEAMAKHQEMDLLVNDLIDVEEEDLAADAMLEMDNLKALQDDINSLIAQPNLWQQFRKKYIGNKKDYALEEQQREKQRKAAIEAEEWQRQQDILVKQKLQEEQKRLQQEKEKERQEMIRQEQERAERERREQEQQEFQRKQRELQEHEQREKERLEKERLEKEKQENERRMQEKKLEQERLEKEKAMRELQQRQELEKQRLKELEEQEKRKIEQAELERRQHEMEKQRREQIESNQSLINTNQQQIKGGLSLQSNILPQQNFQESDQIKIQQLIGADDPCFRTSQVQMPDQSRISSSMMGRSAIQNRLTKPKSDSSQGKRQQPIAIKLTGDISGAPDVIVENPQQKASQQDFYSSQVSVLTDQLKVLQNDNEKLRKLLENEEKTNTELRNKILQQPQSHVIQTDLALQLEAYKLQGEKQLRDMNNLQIEKQEQERKIQELERNIRDQKNNADVLRISLKDSHEQDLKAHTIQSQQLFQEKQALLSQLESLRKRFETSPQLENNIFQLQQQINQLQRDIQDIKKQKDQQAINHEKDIELKIHEIQEQQIYIDTLQKQIDLYKQQVEKGQKDYAILQEKQRESQESTQQQIYDAKRQGLAIQSELNQVQLKLNEKEEEYKRLNLNYQSIVHEKSQLQKNFESAQQQSDQFLKMYQNGDSKNTSLLQQKLKQSLEEKDKMREIHSKELKDKDEQCKEIINQLIEEKQILETKVQSLQEALQQAALNANKMQALQIAPQTPQQMNKLSSKPASLIDKSALSEQISVNVGNQKALEVASQQPEQNIYQPICPLPTFKHFPATCLFNLPKIQEKGRIVTAECLELIFPYQDPADYFQNRQKKNRKGKVIQSTSISNETAHLDTQNRNLFKQRCLGSQGLIYLDNDFQFGLSFQTQNYQGKSYNTYGLYVYNTNQRQDGFFLQFLEVDQFSQFWASPIELRKPLYEASQELVEILVSTTKTPFQLLTVQVGHSAIHPYQFYIPNHICQSIVYRDIRLNEFRNKWASNMKNQMRTELLLLNKAVFGSVPQFLQLIPRLLIYNSHKMNDYEMGIDEIKLVGVGNYYDLQFLIKFEILPDDKICIYLTFDSKYNSKRYLLEQILQGYAFILGNGKSQ